MSESVDLKTYLDVAEGEELDVFRFSAKLCILRSSLIAELKDTNKELDKKYMGDQDFLSFRTERLTPKLDSGFWGPMVIGTVAAAGLLSNVFGWTLFLAILCLGGAFAVGYMVINGRKKTARAQAENELVVYRTEREKHNKKLPTLKKAKTELLGLITQCTDALKAMEKHRECITEKDWPIAHILLEYVNSHRADNLKEALRVYEDAKYYARGDGCPVG